MMSAHMMKYTEENNKDRQRNGLFAEMGYKDYLKKNNNAGASGEGTFTSWSCEMERDKSSKSLQEVLTAPDGKLALDIEALSAAARVFVTGIARQPDLPERLAKWYCV